MIELDINDDVADDDISKIVLNNNNQWDAIKDICSIISNEYNLEEPHEA